MIVCYDMKSNVLHSMRNVSNSSLVTINYFSNEKEPYALHCLCCSIEINDTAALEH